MILYIETETEIKLSLYRGVISCRTTFLVVLHGGMREGGKCLQKVGRPLQYSSTYLNGYSRIDTFPLLLKSIRFHRPSWNTAKSISVLNELSNETIHTFFNNYHNIFRTSLFRIVLKEILFYCWYLKWEHQSNKRHSEEQKHPLDMVKLNYCKM